jgi:CRP-like cAMP-binding protein
VSISLGNAILRSLPSGELDRLAPYFKTVRLTAGQRLCTVDEPLAGIWFPVSGAASRLITLLTGETVEAGIVGNDGVIGLPLVLGGHNGAGACFIHADGNALVMNAADFDEHVRRRGGPLLEALLLYTNLYIYTLGQLTACHCLHRIEQRLSRCILMLADYGDDEFVRITHDTLAEFLGVHRPSITYALQALADMGAIGLERRRVIITDREALLGHACECYSAIRNMTARELKRIRAQVAYAS